MDTLTPTLTHLFRMTITAGDNRPLADTPGGSRRVTWLKGGSFTGPLLAGQVLPGDDWQTIRPDGVFVIDVRLPLMTGDGHGILMRYQGFRHGPAEVLARLGRGEAVSPDEYYFRITASFETSAEPYGWLNRVVAIGCGHRLPEAVIYDLWAVG